MLTHERARAFYDWFGAWQDRQRFYEQRAVDDLLRHSSPARARSILEFGCGTGRFAASLLAQYAPQETRYLGLDISTTMVRLAQARLARFGARARVVLTSGATRLDVESSSFDRFFSTYVLDLLAESDIQSLVAEAHRVLTPGGLLGLVSLTHGGTALSRVVERMWRAAYRVRPELVGGCRPISLETFVGEGWAIRHTRRVVQWGVPSEVLIAERG
jgi:ubiquinone/menaquinone biosynthesis C-methylase UbiE